MNSEKRLAAWHGLMNDLLDHVENVREILNILTDDPDATVEEVLGGMEPDNPYARFVQTGNVPRADRALIVTEPDGTKRVFLCGSDEKPDADGSQKTE